MICIDGKKTTSQRKIANEYGEHLLRKIDKLTKDILDEKEVAIKLFQKLIPKVDEDFVIKEARYKEVYKIISKLKPTKSRGDNEVTNMLIREIPQIMTLATMHLFNSMVRTGSFPKDYKTSHIIPLCKKDKDELDIDSF